MVDFKTISSKKFKFGKNNFIEVARKSATTEDGSSSEFISVSRGYTLQDGTERFKKSISFPSDKETKEEIAKAIMDA